MDRRLIEEFEACGPRLRQAVAGLSPEDLTARPGPGDWSILELVIHLTDSDSIAIDRMKRMLIEDDPPLLYADETAYVRLLASHEQSLEDALTLFEVGRRQFARVLRALPDEAFDRRGTHNRRGVLTVGGSVKDYIDHVGHHLAFLLGKRAAPREATRPRRSGPIAGVTPGGRIAGVNRLPILIRPGPAHVRPRGRRPVARAVHGQVASEGWLGSSRRSPRGLHPSGSDSSHPIPRLMRKVRVRCPRLRIPGRVPADPAPQHLTTWRVVDYVAHHQSRTIRAQGASIREDSPGCVGPIRHRSVFRLASGSIVARSAFMLRHLSVSERLSPPVRERVRSRSGPEGVDLAAQSCADLADLYGEAVNIPRSTPGHELALFFLPDTGGSSGPARVADAVRHPHRGRSGQGSCPRPLRLRRVVLLPEG